MKDGQIVHVVKITLSKEPRSGEPIANAEVICNLGKRPDFVSEDMWDDVGKSFGKTIVDILNLKTRPF